MFIFFNMLYILNVFRAEVMHVLKNCAFTGIWSFFAAADVLGIRLLSVYPTYGGGTVRQDLHRVIEPAITATDSGKCLQKVL